MAAASGTYRDVTQASSGVTQVNSVPTAVSVSTGIKAEIMTHGLREHQMA